jgi:GDPmannose 4,6-dehydratase
MTRTALITGITGQDGSYLAEFLLSQGYRVVGMVRRASTENFERIAHLHGKIELRQADLLDQLSLIELVKDVQPNEIYNLAAQSFVPTSWQQPVLTAEFDAVGVSRVLEAIRLAAPEARFYQASSSEMFGKVRETPQTETTPFHPRSPYGVAKVYGHYITVNYRESYDLFACSGILFNHEGAAPRSRVRHAEGLRGRRAHQARAAVGASHGQPRRAPGLGLRRRLRRGDVAHAPAVRPDDYVVATGETHSVKELVEVAFGCVGLDWEQYVKIDPAFLRPAEVDLLVGDASKAKRGPRLDAAGDVPRPRRDDGARRPRAAPGEVVRVLVTGIGGFVGPWLQRALVAHGHEVLGSSAKRRAAAGRAGHHADVTVRDQVEAVLRDVRPDAVIHLAAISFVPEAEGDPETAYRVNVGGTVALMAAMRAVTPSARLLWVGSSDAYGAVTPADLPITEDAPFRPLSVYGASKAAGDVTAGQWARSYGLDVVRARPFNHMGPGQRPTFVSASIARQMARMERGEQEPVPPRRQPRSGARLLRRPRHHGRLRDAARARPRRRGLQPLRGEGVSIAEVIAVLRTHCASDARVERSGASAAQRGRARRRQPREGDGRDRVDAAHSARPTRCAICSTTGAAAATDQRRGTPSLAATPAKARTACSAARHARGRLLPPAEDPEDGPRASSSWCWSSSRRWSTSSRSCWSSSAGSCRPASSISSFVGQLARSRPGTSRRGCRRPSSSVP